jgi:hypothetical protein
MIFYEDRKSMGGTWKNPPWKKPHSAHLRTLQGIVSTSSRPPFAELPPGTPFFSFSSGFHQVSGFLTSDGHLDHCTVAWVFEHIFTK